MNFFEKELRDLFGSSTTLRDAHYCGRTCLAKLDEDLRVKLQFTTTGYADHYDAIKLAAISKMTVGRGNTALSFLGKDSIP